MVEIVDELKAKLGEIAAQIELFRREIGILDDQRSAFEKVIKVYDPSSRRLPPFRNRHALHHGKRPAARSLNF